MSDFTVIHEVSKALTALLVDAFNADDNFTESVSEDDIVLEDMASAQTDVNLNAKLSLWLYQVTENEFVKNQPPQRTQNGLAFTPLALNFHYLVTPLFTKAERNQLLLGKVMQVFYENAIYTVASEDSDVFEEIRIIFSRTTLEELTRIWESRRAAYQLSVCYEVRVARIRTTREDSVTPIRHRESNVPKRGAES